MEKSYCISNLCGPKQSLYDEMLESIANKKCGPLSLTRLGLYALGQKEPETQKYILGSILEELEGQYKSLDGRFSEIIRSEMERISCARDDMKHGNSERALHDIYSSERNLWLTRKVYE